MLKQFNKLNSKLNTLLNPISYIDREWFNSFAIISFNPNIKPEKPKFEYLVRNDYTESDIENSMASNYEIKNVVENSTQNVLYIKRIEDGTLQILETTIINDNDFIAGPFFIEKEANEVLSILSTIY